MKKTKNESFGHSFPKMKNRYTILGLIIIAMLIIAGCNNVLPNSHPEDSKPRVALAGNNFAVESGTVMKFSSVQEIKDFLFENTMQQSQSYSNSFRSGRDIDMAMPMMAMAESSSGKPVGAGSNSGASDYSETNIQVDGVDEPDFVKNDNKYIYMIQDQTLYIVDAYPGEDAEIVSEIIFEGNPRNLFVNEDKVIVFSNAYERKAYIAEFDYMPRERGISVSHAYVYDVSDKDDPELINDFSIEGNYYDARMIGDYVYFISQQNIYYDPIFFDTPVLMDGSSVKIKPEVYYFPNPETNYNFNTITSFNIDDSSDVNSKTFMMGHSNTLYVSEDNIYISYKKNLPWSHYAEDSEYAFYNIVLPLLSSDIKNKINSIKNDNSVSEGTKWSKISLVLEEMYNEMSESNKDNLVDEIREALEVYNIKQEIERSKTVIHRISIDNGNIDYGARGEVSGSLLNQFSLDEHQDNLRVATTTSIWVGEREVYSNVFILNKNMEVVGDIEDIAPGERIYSTRFVGDRLYMVTFKNIDPLFVIDLSVSTNPKILGELKIPGYSTYLHPYDEDHIIGVGVTTEENQWGGVSTSGLKIAMFDVTDVENPKEIDKYEVGEAGTYSVALYEHKAFLFDKEKGLSILPVREVTGRYKDPVYGYYHNSVWNGVYVFDVDESGFDLRGKVEHQDDSDNSLYRNYGKQVLRSIFMGGTLYTISSNLIKISSLIDLSDINEVLLD